MGTLQNKLAIELCRGRNDVEHEPPGRAGGVDSLGEHPKVDLALSEILGRRHELADGGREPVELPHRQRVSSAKIIERSAQLGPSRCAPDAPR